MRIEILDDAGNVINTIEASEEIAEQMYPGHWRLAAEQWPGPNTPQTESRLISVGAFFDRFGLQKWDILADQSPIVQAVVKDASVRRYIDLGNSHLPSGLQKLQQAGHQLDVTSILNSSIQAHELP